MQRAIGQMQNPYGLSPQGQSGWQGFNQGSRPFNPYGGGAAGAGYGGQQQGGGGGFGSYPPPAPPTQMGGGGSSPGIPQTLSSGMQPAGQSGAGGLMSLIQALMASRGAGTSSQLQQPQQMTRPGGASGNTVGYGGNMLGTPIPGEQGFDGTNTGYGGNRMGTFQPPMHQPQNVMALMRAMGQVPRPHPMPMGMGRR